LPRARAVRALRLKNAVNGYHLDRAAKAFVVEAYADGRLVATARGEFPPPALDQPFQRIDLVATGVTHVRIDISSFHGSGGGLGEVEVE
jgi:hypothetical protein